MDKLDLVKTVEDMKETQEIEDTWDDCDQAILTWLEELANIKSVLGKTVYVSPSGGYYYKAIILGYGAYGTDPEYKTYCVKVIKENGTAFVDYFPTYIEESAFLKWKEEFFGKETPFGCCRKCGYKFSAELINVYNMKYCIRCGEELNKNNQKQNT